MKNKLTKWIISILLLIIISIILIFALKPKQSDKKDIVKKNVTKKVDAYILTPSLLIDEITVNGNLLAVDEVELRNEVSGRIVKINLPEGKSVRKGALLVKIYDDDLQANLKKLQTQLSVQEQILKRQSELLKVNGISQNEYDQTQLQVNSLKSDIDYQKSQIRKTEVLAPFDGVIGLRNVSQGAMVTASTVLATIRTDSKLKLDFFVAERYSSQVKIGQKVDFKLSNNDRGYIAKVIASEKGIDNNTRNLKVRAIIEKPKKELIAGAFALVNLRLSENQNALMVPTQAIIPGEYDTKVIIAHNGKAHFVKVKTGVRQTEKIEILDGVKTGDTIITTGVLFLKENSKLQYSKINQ
jgi:membrane fusion protein, multidrug efflux system